jgi:hypothetical protein
MMDAMERITDNIVTDELDDLLDDHHTEAVTYVRDDGGNWYLQTSTDHGAYSQRIWWAANDTEANLMDGIILLASKAT